MRAYYAQAMGRPLSCEVLLDNEAWEEMRSDIAAHDWPRRESFYGVRRFLVIQAEREDAATPGGAVALLAEALAARPEMSQEDMCRALEDAGVPEPAAKRAVRFTQVAWGRILLDGLPKQFSPDYFVFGADGSVLESGRLEGEPFFAAAARLGARHKGSPGFMHVAMTSADFHAVNNALNAGSQARDLVMGPSYFFAEDPTDEGWRIAEKIIAGRVTPRAEAERPTGTAVPQAVPQPQQAGPEPEAAPARPPRSWWRLWGR